MNQKKNVNKVLEKTRNKKVTGKVAWLPGP